MMSQSESYQFCGNVANKELVLRETKAGKAVTNITLIRNWKSTKENGEVSEGKRVCEVAIYGKAAEKAVKELKTGYRVLISGIPEVEQYEYKGEKAARIKVHVERYQSFGKYSDSVEAEKAEDAVAKS